VASHYFELATALGRLLAARGDTLVYGGGGIGLMGALAEAAHQNGGRVVGVIPQHLVDREFAYESADEMVVTEDLRQRKAIMEQRAAAFAVLPGGFGTLEEMFEMLTLRLLEQHEKPLALVNAYGFYDRLLDFFETLYDEGFARARSRSHYAVAAEPDGALRALDAMDAAQAP
jgi:uncharacterized protein (TIGR00730 family)